MSSPSPDPEYISFLFSSNLKPDCVFLVGNKKLEMWNPYVYGHDTTSLLGFDESDDLFYVAHMYMIDPLKRKLATRLMSLLTSENICSLLNNPAIYTELEINNAVTKILRYETDRVLASPLFLGLSSEGFIKILEQDGLNVPEIEVWRAALKWARHNADSDDGDVLRQQMGEATKHIRICTLNSEEFCQEVAPTGIISETECMAVCVAIGRQEKQDNLVEFCNEIKPRDLLSKKKLYHLNFVYHGYGVIPDDSPSWKDSTITVYTNDCAIELLPLECLAVDRPQTTPEGSTYEVGCKITITRIHPIGEFPVTVRFVKQVEYWNKYKIPLISNGRNMTLLPNSTYTISMRFDNEQRMYSCQKSPFNPKTFRNGHLSVEGSQGYIVFSERCHMPIDNIIFPTDHLAYKTEAD